VKRGRQSPSGTRRSRTLALSLVGCIFAGVGGAWWAVSTGRDAPPQNAAHAGLQESPVSLGRSDLVMLTDAVRSSLTLGAAEPEPEVTGRLGQRLGPVFAALRHGGTWVGSAWASGDTTFSATQAAVSEAQGDQGARSVDAVDLCLSHSYQDLPAADLPGNIDVGVLGLQIEHAGHAATYSPTLMLANNWDFVDVLEVFAEAHDTEVGDLGGSDTKLQVFECDQVLVKLDDPAPAVVMQRGNSPIRLDGVNQQSATRLAHLMGGWLARHVHADGRMTYEYWPSRSEESTDNNTIRQWMATLALIRYARWKGGQAVYDLAERNIRFNLRSLYEADRGLGLVVEPSDGDVKLGAIALAALAIMEHPARSEFAREEAALRRTVRHLWRPNGQFVTFYRPAGRMDEENFYPGEALLMWAHLYRETRDPGLLGRFMRSFEHYREWHLDEENRNPAFVPWHTQAYAEVWRVTRDRRLLDFIFEMNDWLVGIQQWRGAPYSDVRGRFYDPDRPQFGEPHASATGVYLEGLAEAHRLAVIVGDRARQDRYFLAIRRGLRNVMQLQFVDDVDMYYTGARRLVRGGIRTEVYDNVIRVDNVQHNLLAVLNILASEHLPAASE
jgi:hypothetical protein